MRDEQARRRPDFRPGLGLRLADGQVWSLPVPVDAGGDPAGASATWDDPDYRGILRALVEAAEPGERFRAELALAIHLLRRNYRVDGADVATLLDDQDGGRIGVDVAGGLRELARAHLGTAIDAHGRDRRPVLDLVRDRFLGLIRAASRGLAGRRAEVPPDLGDYAHLARTHRSSTPGAR